MKRISIIQHVPFEGPAFIGQWLTAAKHSVTVVRLYSGDKLPDTTTLDALIIMGGPMGAYDEHLHPWLAQEKALIRSSIDAGKIIIGICLGAQLLATALGGQVEANGHKEIGWFPVQIRSSFAAWLGMPVTDTITMFHWHGDRFSIPPGAVAHASSEACSNQLFTYGDNVIGIQFHPEVTDESINDLLQHAQADLIDAPYVSTAEEIRAGRSKAGIANEFMRQILEKLFA